jgi:ABC-type transport system involved in cytochrome c biogenesis permease component
MTVLTSTLLGQGDERVMLFEQLAAGGFSLFMLVYFALSILWIVGMWKMFDKAGKPGWAAIIPIYNIIVMLEVAGKPIWWILLLCIPVVNFVIAILMMLAVAERFGKGGGFAVGLILLPFIFFPMLGFGDATYQGGTPAATA